ncbi:hypothetical protein EUTSA_v10012071mg, partial [Eutrema salsugineum]
EVLEVVGKLEESSPVMETINVNGFLVLPSQVESVNRLFERHQDISSNFHPKNPFLKTAYMNVLLNLTQTLRQSPQEVSKNDMADQYASLAYLTEAGFELGWLEMKLDKPLKQKCLDLEAQTAKTKAASAKAILSLDDDDIV